jgi:hypothetical protein
LYRIIAVINLIIYIYGPCCREIQRFVCSREIKIMYPAAACLHGDPWISSKKLIWTTNNTIQMDIKENFSCCGMFNPHFLDNCDVRNTISGVSKNCPSF